MQMGVIGLGKMGKNLALNMLDKKIEVAAWNRSPEPAQELRGAGATIASSVEELISILKTPRVVWIIMPAGAVSEEYMQRAGQLLEPEDILIDGGNSFYLDSMRRGEALSLKRIRFLDIGISGGPNGARNGACMMIGGAKNDYEKLIPAWEKLCIRGGFGYMGKTGAGHFAKMVHNGIEYGMMQAIGEGAQILKQAEFNFDLKQVMAVYNRGSVIESRLVGWLGEALAEDVNLSGISPVIGHTGEGEWTVETAKKMEIETPVIEAALEVRKKSNPDGGFSNRAVSAMRGKFGGHSVDDNRGAKG